MWADRHDETDSRVKQLCKPKTTSVLTQLLSLGKSKIKVATYLI